MCAVLMWPIELKELIDTHEDMCAELTIDESAGANESIYMVDYMLMTILVSYSIPKMKDFIHAAK